MLRFFELVNEQKSFRNVFTDTAGVDADTDAVAVDLSVFEGEPLVEVSVADRQFLPAAAAEPGLAVGLAAVASPASVVAFAVDLSPAEIVKQKSFRIEVERNILIQK